MNVDDPIPPSIAAHGEMIEIPDSPQAKKSVEQPAQDAVEGPTSVSGAEPPKDPLPVEGPTPTSVPEEPKDPVEGQTPFVPEEPKDPVVPTSTSVEETPKDPDVENLITEEVGDKNQPIQTKITSALQFV